MSTRRPARRIHRDPAAVHRWPLKHIQLGIETLIEIARVGFLTNSQIDDLLFAERPNMHGALRPEGGSRRAADRTLRQLWEHGYLDRVPVVLTSRRTGGGYLAFINVLTALGMESVEHYRTEIGAQFEIRAKIGDPGLSPQQLEHTVTLYDLYALFRRAVGIHDLFFRGWLDDRQLAALRAQREILLINVPDAAFVIGRRRDDALLFFLEIDLGTETISRTSEHRRDWQGKITNYELYFQTELARDPLLRTPVRPIVLTVTTSERRLANMLTATAAAGGGADYWYTTRDSLDPAPLDRATAKAMAPADRDRRNETRWVWRRQSLWQPIWRVCTDDTPRTLSRLITASTSETA